MLALLVIHSCFFFQAEDGIRDLYVTGVQTCALPISSATANAYGTRPGGLIAYRGDSTLFVDPASLSMLLIDPNGKIARVRSEERRVGKECRSRRLSDH